MAGLKISVCDADGYAVFDLEGDVTFGEGSSALRAGIREMIREGRTRIILNFADVRYVDSSGIGELISGLTAVKREGGELKLVNVTDRLRHLLEITKLLGIFGLSEESAGA